MPPEEMRSQDDVASAPTLVQRMPPEGNPPDNDITSADVSHQCHVLHARSRQTAETAHERFAQGRSLYCFRNVASAAECHLLLQDASRVAAQQNAMSVTDPARALWSIPEVPGRMRLPIDKAVDKKSRALCDCILMRAIDQLRCVRPLLLPTLFGTSLDSASTLIDNPQLTFSPREPAINIYTARGRFKPQYAAI